MDYEHVSELAGNNALLKFVFAVRQIFCQTPFMEKNYRSPESGKQLIPVIGVRSIGIVEKMSPKRRAGNARQQPLVSRVPDYCLS